MSLGFVYILSNPAMPGFVKIGYTTYIPEKRVDELSGATGVPKRFILQYWCLTQDPEDVERRVHERLARMRVSNDREFFEMSVPDAIVLIDELARPVSSRYERPRGLPDEIGTAPPLICPFCGKKNETRLCGACGGSW